MKTIQFFLLASFFSVCSFATMAQSGKADFDVSGNCGMCKKTIEKAAKDAGATFAEWNQETKRLAVKYGRQTDLLKIQRKIAEAGYDNAGARASDEAYNQLHACCQYDRAPRKENIKTDKKEGGNDAEKSCCEKL